MIGDAIQEPQPSHHHKAVLLWLALMKCADIPAFADSSTPLINLAATISSEIEEHAILCSDLYHRTTQHTQEPHHRATTSTPRQLLCRGMTKFKALLRSPRPCILLRRGGGDAAERTGGMRLFCAARVPLQASCVLLFATHAAAKYPEQLATSQAPDL